MFCSGLYFVQGRVYVLQTTSPYYFRAVDDSWQALLGFSVNIFATKVFLVSASLVQREDLSGSVRRFFFRENAMTLRFFSLQRRRLVCYKVTPPWRVKNTQLLTEN
jgi:hypothetical protein